MDTTVVSVRSKCVLWRLILPLLDHFCESSDFEINGHEMKLKICSEWLDQQRMQNFRVFLQNPPNDTHILGHILCSNNAKFNLGWSCIFQQNAGYVEIFTFTVLKIITCGESLNCPITIAFDFDSKTLDVLNEDGINWKDEKVDSAIYLDCVENCVEDMEKLFDNPEYSDLTMVSGERTFSVSRNILSARSDVLATMFQTDMLEHRTGTVNVTDIDSSVLEQFLRFIYSGRVKTLCVHSACNLYRAGDKYAVDSLKHYCVCFLIKNLTEENVYEVLLLAETFNDRKLLDCTISFIVNRQEILKSAAWNEFAKAHAPLAVEVYQEFHRNN